ncbi:CPBP family glutamic-type intramembrane protease [Ferviditalea candida]|uniref:CPBP family intramembrane glutamic endopeptidase n=1 Tax=Ferviditalea candida TaxID=3108399 RepID=A0ABU5ZNF9_9BACL|nr:CPBP family intramembrane glutamic endopeptidase [Paenibacillaceae bacterium T2]
MSWQVIPGDIILVLIAGYVASSTFPASIGVHKLALPRLQSRFSPLIASIILGFFWGMFHWSGLFIGYRGDFSWFSLFIVTFGEIGLAIMYTWLYNRVSGKSLLPFILLHASMNSTNDYLPRTSLVQYIFLTIIIIAMVFADRMWKRPPIQIDVITQDTNQ